MGWTAAHDTWEPIHNLVEDAPALTEQYLRAHTDDSACKSTLKQYF